MRRVLDMTPFVVEALRDLAEGRFADHSKGVCFALARSLRNRGDYVTDAYRLVFAAGGAYCPFYELDRDYPGPKWDGEKGEIRRMFCGMLASRLERDGLSSIVYID
jgi:hypothetical protein